IKDLGGLRNQFTHVTDVAATLLDVVGIPLPARVDGVPQQPMDGVSFARTFFESRAPSGHHTQYFEQIGNRTVYQDGWVGAARHVAKSAKEITNFSRDKWELYHVSEDFSEAHDLAKQHPEKLKMLQRLFDLQATNNSVYPLGGSFDEELPPWKRGKREFV